MVQGTSGPATIWNSFVSVKNILVISNPKSPRLVMVNDMGSEAPTFVSPKSRTEKLGTTLVWSSKTCMMGEFVGWLITVIITVFVEIPARPKSSTATAVNEYRPTGGLFHV